MILIAVALFAALAYAITQSGRGGGAISKEQTKIYVAQIFEVEGDIRAGIQRIVLTGTPVDSIKAGMGTEWAGWSGLTGGGQDWCTTGTTCLFAPEGGGVSIPELPNDIFETGKSCCGGCDFENKDYCDTEINGLMGSDGSGSPGDVAIPTQGTDTPEDIFAVAPIKKEVCDELNKELGLDPTPEAWANVTHLAGCAEWGGIDGYYVYYSLLHAR